MAYSAVYFFTALIAIHKVKCSLSSECETWKDIRQNVEKSVFLSSCNNSCSGMICSGKMQHNNFSAGIVLNLCEDPATINLFADIPLLGIHNWKRTFTHTDSFDVIGEIQGQLNFKRSEKQIIMGLKFKLLDTFKKNFPISLNIPFEATIFENVVIPISSCSAGNESKLNIFTMVQPKNSEVEESTPVLMSKDIKNGNCTISNSSCGPNEMCKQVNIVHDVGICVCLPSFFRKGSGKCVHIRQLVTTSTIVPNYGPSSGVSTITTTTNFLLQVILIPICVFILLVVLVYLAVRFHVFRAFRNRFRVQVYEHVLLGQQEDSDEPLTDPVA